MLFDTRHQRSNELVVKLVFARNFPLLLIWITVPNARKIVWVPSLESHWYTPSGQFPGFPL